MSLDYYSITIETPFKESIKQIKEPTFWLPFLPGYIQHNQISNNNYLINLFLSLGPVTRETTLLFYFEPERKINNIQFTFSSKNKHVTGLGELIISQYSDSHIELGVSLDLRLKGRKSLLLTPLIPSVKESWAKNILNEVKTSLENN